MGHKRRRQKRIDPEVLARRAGRRAQDRLWRRDLGMIAVLVCVGLFAGIMLVEACWPIGHEVSHDGRYRRRNTLVLDVAVEGTLGVLRWAGLSDGWIVGVLGAVVLGSVGAIAHLVGRMGRMVGGREEAARRREDSAR
jgi:hypothetical protein